MNDIIEKIKAKAWENRVGRPGFLQSKAISIEAEMQPVRLTPSVTLQYDSELWVKESNLYDDEPTKAFEERLAAAFAENQKWPVELASAFVAYDAAVEEFKQKSALDWDTVGKNQKLAHFKNYVELLTQIAKYYVIAVPLATFCEQKLKEIDESLLQHAVSYKPLAMDSYYESLRQLKRGNTNEALEQHLSDYRWIKAAYNVLDPYTREDVLAVLDGTLPEQQPSVPAVEHYLQAGLHVSIYLRNHMKELSQQLWCYVEPTAQSMARDLGVTRDEFFQMTHQEVVLSYEGGQSVITPEEFTARQEGFVTGFVHAQQILLTGSIATELYRFYNPVTNRAVSELKGQVACRGIVRGTVKVILGSPDFKKFTDGDVLVTTMTTPDFVLLMKKAAAIVTDEGGITCHAAIISRELKKPCVIGTKVATKILKDGDMIEVDGDKGIVRIISK